METKTDYKTTKSVNYRLSTDRETNEQKLERLFEENIRSSFSELEEIVSENPNIKALKEYGKGIEEKFAFLKKPVGLTPQQADLLMSRIPKEDRDSGFDAVILKLQRDTDYLEELEDVGISSALVDGLENGKYGAYTIFLNPDNFFSRMLKKRNIGGGYLPLLDTIIIPEKPPTSEEMWLKLATEGQLPNFINSLDHELTHDKQWKSSQRAAILTLSGLPLGTYMATYSHLGFWSRLGIQEMALVVSRLATKRLRNDTLLSETQAYEAAGSSPTYHDPEMDEAKEVATHIIDAYGLKGRNYLDALIAYEKIHLLRIMGVDDNEIGKIVSGARFDSKNRTYPKLDKRVDDERDKWGVANDWDFHDVGRALIAQHELELRFQRHLAEQIAARELQRETGKWFD